ncbi:diguanylate cyclase domain-containing protein [Pleionea sp. CnH1-48]|uniref:diguanylate cyclase domain-containing protein n=1 Tax=Pleionea sp. CnH1-48 TaxID=2954494 RepID=UPI00209683F5|nr:diguanylate cyclase [Pleionea sp. CnH1-48]MCO7222745.1 diguanylate cyclase [Pleionea sp. CnH1-48]
MLLNLVARSLLAKLLLIFICGLAAVLVLQLTIRQYSILPQLELLEKQSDLKDLQRIVSSVDRLFDELDSVVYDNAVWDEMYKVVEQKDIDYLKQNYFIKESYLTLNINGFYFYDKQHALITGLSTDGQFTPLSANVFDAPNEQIVSLILTTEEESKASQLAQVKKRGFIEIDKKLAMFVSSNIIPSAGRGESRGTMLVWRFVNQKVQSQLSDLTQLKVVLSKGSDRNVSLSAQSIRENKVALERFHRDEQSNLSLTFSDIYHQPLLAVSYKAPKRMFDDRLFDTALIGASAGILVILALMFCTLNKIVVQPILELQKTIRRVLNLGDYTQTTGMKRNDEIGRLAFMVDTLFNNVFTQQAELIKHNIKLKELSDTDELTGIANRRSLENYLGHLSEETLYVPESLSVLMIDVDHFKLYNDHYGHAAGDEALKEVASTIEDLTRSHYDMVARYGGEEFSVLLRKANKSRAVKVANKLCQSIFLLRIPHESSPTSEYLTISIGVASCPPKHKCNNKQLFEAADEALYQAKSNGRNQVVSRECD